MMENLKLAEVEYRFVCIVWENEPLPSGRLVELCAEKLGWKKSTTYTVLKRLVERGVLRNENSVVTAAVAKEDVLEEESHSVVDKTFDGSLPSFLTAFLGRRSISKREAEELKALIDRFRKDEGDD